MPGVDRFIQELEGLGYGVERVPVGGDVYAVIRSFTVPLGQFEGRVVDLGLKARYEYPRQVDSAIHVRATPQLFEKGDSIPGVRNIIESPLGDEWCYWSRNFNWRGDRTARRLMNQIYGVFKNA